MWLILFLSLFTQAASALDYGEFKDKVQPLLAEKRPGHARCITCHSTGTAFRLQPLPGRPPYELGDVFQRAIDAGVAVSAIQVGRTRDLTSPVDLVRENFPYLVA